MKTVLTLVCILAAAHYATAQCSTMKEFDTELVPRCDPNDVYIKWPDYANFTSYYTCFGVGNPVVTPCEAGEYFCYVLQKCGPCTQYIPPPPCTELKTQNPPDCVPLGNGGTTDSGGNTPSGSSYPTPNYPATSAPTTKTTKTTTEKTTTTPGEDTTGGPTPSVETPPAEEPTPDGGIAGPPTPVSSAPGVPTPPTPAPTPPNVEVNPPTLAPSN